MILYMMVVYNKRMQKLIFSYWDSPYVPHIVHECIKSWKRHNPDYRVVVLNRGNVGKLINIPTELAHFYDNKESSNPKALFADVVRILLIEKYGGYWIDATVYAYCSFDSLIPGGVKLDDLDFFGYYMPGFTTNKQSPIVENWFFGAKRGSLFIKEWKDVFFRIREYKNTTKYYEDIEKQGVDLQNLLFKEYLTMHVAAQYVLQKSDRKYKIIVNNCDLGPFAYLQTSDWDQKKAFDLLLSDNDIYYKQTLLKMRGTDRKYITGNKQIHFQKYLDINSKRPHNFSSWNDPIILL
jgi:hypothetical protein